MDFFTFTILTVFILGAVIIKKTKFYWRFLASVKWEKIQTDIKEIRTLHKEYFQNLKEIRIWDMYSLITTKRKFKTHKAKCLEYMKFCEEKKIPVNHNITDICNVIKETELAIYHPNDVLDYLLDDAKKAYDDEYNNMNIVGESLLKERQNAIVLISQVEELINTIAKRPKSFEVALEEIKVEKGKFQSVIDFANLERENLKNGAKGMGMGVAIGSAVAGLAPSTALWIATTFGTASTGTAISALSGAAATNAALAWLGGGALASGGAGMVAGQALLALAGPIGWSVAAGGVLLSILSFINKTLKIQGEKKEEIKRIKQFTESLQEVRLKIEQIKVQTVSIHNLLLKQLEDCLEFANVDYSTITSQDKKRLGTLVNNTTSLSLLLGKTLEESK